MPTDLFLYGAGGHGKVVLDALLRLGYRPRVFDGDPARADQVMLGIRVESHSALAPFTFQRGHVAIGDNVARQRATRELAVQKWLTVIHPMAVVARQAALGDAIFVAATAVLGPDTRIDDGCIINHGAVIDHDCCVGAFSHIAPRATLGGQVVIGKRVLIGSGAVVLPGRKIGDGATIGAGAVVTRDIAPGDVVKGIPATKHRP